MRFIVLGPVGLSKGSRSLPALAPRQRAILAYLLLHAGTVISADRLIGAMWGMTPPGTARTQIQAAIAAIRQALWTADAGDILQTRPAGYILLTEPGQVDLEVFTGQAADPEAGVEQLRAALALWRGEPLAGLTADFVDQAPAPGRRGSRRRSGEDHPGHEEARRRLVRRRSTGRRSDAAERPSTRVRVISRSAP